MPWHSECGHRPELVRHEEQTMTQLLEEYAAQVYGEGPETLATWPASNRAVPLHTFTPQIMVRLVGVLLTLAVSAVHVADQGGITALTEPAWLGWAFRLTEVGGA